MKRFPFVVACVLSMGIWLGNAQQGQQRGAQTKGAAAQKGGQPAPGGSFANRPNPIAKDELIGAIQAQLADARLIEVMRRRRLDFRWKEDVLKEFSAAGASPAVITAIMEIAEREPEPPPPPPPPKQGDLRVVCQPLECEVAVNGVSRGRTANGALVVPSLNEGKYVVDFKKEAYLSQQQTVLVRSGEKNEVAAKMLPDMAAQYRLGQTGFEAMLAALGGDDGIKETAWITAKGSAKFYDPSGQTSEWTITALTKPVGMVYFDLSGAGAKHWITLMQNGYYTSNRFDRLPDRKEIDNGIRRFREVQMGAILDRIRNSQMKLRAEMGLEQNKDFVFRAEGPAERMEFQLGPNRLPVRIKFETQAGLGGWQAFLSDWVPRGKTPYPGKIIVRFLDAEKHGMEFRFDSVAISPNLRDSDFKKSGRMNAL